MAGKSAEIEETKIELTPMIDVVFLLLIFFIVTIKFKVLEGKLETELPKDVGVNASTDLPKEKIEISIKKDPGSPEGLKVFVQSRPMPNLATFRAELKRWLDLDPEARATLYPEFGVTYESVVKVVDECLKVNLTNITFAGVEFNA
ncbi:MAG: biopolymer transporter ExbD [Planctomycetes bacterium]|nr:biopolymer transporter ExbD [Planctomycetota bacterium]